MRRALELAERGRGAVEPNPLVGAVLARGDELLAEGWHQRFGGPHAEVEVFDQWVARGDTKIPLGATLYVTLEPCCHYGKTPPCTDRVLTSGIGRVVVAMTDPFPRVSGQGINLLRAAGCQVEVGLLESESRRLNAPYLHLLATGRPYVHAKWAMTLDGKITTATGESKWITNETSRVHAHQFRGTLDAIIVGLGTVIADDPLLTARPPGSRTPCRVVLDCRARLPLHSQLARTANETRTLVVVTEAAPSAHLAGLRQAGCEYLMVPTDDDGTIALGPLLTTMGQWRWTNVLVEGGPTLLGAFLREGWIDALRVYLAPRLVGGLNAKSPIAGLGIASLKNSLFFSPPQILHLDGDVFLSATRIPVILDAGNTDT